MLVGRVERRIWGTRKAEGLAGLTLLEVRPLRLLAGGELRYDKHGAAAPAEVAAQALTGGLVVAADRLGAGAGEIVLCATGSRVRDLVFGARAPLKTVVLAIVDRVEAGPC